MSDGNEGLGRALPPRLDAALRAARTGHHVSFDALRAAVCLYIEELIIGGHTDDEIREHVAAAFKSVSDETRDEPVAWNDQLIDELIELCRDRVA